jgi:hypothetical protein
MKENSSYENSPVRDKDATKKSYLEGSEISKNVSKE